MKRSSSLLVTCAVLLNPPPARGESSMGAGLDHVRIHGHKACDVPGLVAYRGSELQLPAGSIVDRRQDPEGHATYIARLHSGEFVTLPIGATLEAELIAVRDDRIVVANRGRESWVPRSCVASFETTMGRRPPVSGPSHDAALAPGMRVRITGPVGDFSVQGIMSRRDGHISFQESVISQRSREGSSGNRIVEVELTGARRMVVPLDAAPFEALFLRREAEGMVLSVNGDEETIFVRWEAAARLEVRGPRSSAGARGLKGALIAAILAGALGATDSEGAGWGLIAAAAAAPVGLLIGAASGGRPWTPVDAGEARLSLAPTPGGAEAFVGFGFKGRSGR